MDPNKRGNPPFEPSSYAAGLERRVKRLSTWAEDATDATHMLLDGNESDRKWARAWWRKHLDQPQVVTSGILTEGGDAKQAPGDSLSSPTGEAGDAQGHSDE